MYSNNPFNSWSQSNDNSDSWGAPSVYGALPYPATSLPTFYFTSFTPVDLNCSVMDSQSNVCYRIVTDQRYTMIKNKQENNVALIEWQVGGPKVEIRGVLSKQPIGAWLHLSRNKISRTMTVRGMQYTWIARNEAINLYGGNGETQTVFARISRTNGTICLEVSHQASQLDLMDTIVSAALLLQCGRNID